MEPSLQISSKDKLAIEAALNAALLLPQMAFMNAPILKQLYLHFGKKLCIFVYGTMKIFGYEWKIDVKVDGANAAVKTGIDELDEMIQRGASDEEIKNKRKELVDNARKLVRSAGSIV